MWDIEQNLRDVRRRVALAAQRVSRDPDEVTIVAVTKAIDVERIMLAYKLGLRHFGENRVQEAQAKVTLLRSQIPTSPTAQTDIHWHMVGHLQTNKAKAAVKLFDFIHSVDSLRLATAISDCALKLGLMVPILLQVNISGEATKFGFSAEDVPAAVSEIACLPGIQIRGLMTIAPIVADPEDARPILRRLRELRDELRQAFPALRWSHLSMGMTDDFEVAIEEGATLVRLGRAIFGSPR
ncbi:MAG: YggS family pyridoxal phosphate-dependent enzyme [Chloroflexi bacterium]|nr:YggS family pyridoxal phosphate-dependent enzyme [Chloroflexota bacterium]MCL5075636.1 YggS family pyridoxal phosphate-dependent enzyme [Chloroflexota bacterium]